MILIRPYVRLKDCKIERTYFKRTDFCGICGISVRILYSRRAENSVSEIPTASQYCINSMMSIPRSPLSILLRKDCVIFNLFASSTCWNRCSTRNDFRTWQKILYSFAFLDFSFIAPAKVHILFK